MAGRVRTAMLSTTIERLWASAQC
ncbi:protein of unknown function [Rhodovastum atsumiense]|nr:protein of unknown function [Rhodovastum atsumiense]